MIPPRAFHQIRQLIWLYFWLLIFEGALRKWIVPQLSAPLLIVRDPVVIMIYFIALRVRAFPRDGFTVSLIFLAILAFIASIMTNILGNGRMIVTAFGARCNFLHIPFIFLVPKFFNRRDVIKMGKCFLILAIPMAIIMVIQFNSPMSHFLNRAARSQGGSQITSMYGRVRPPGTFSYITGAAQFFGIVTAFLLYGLVHLRIYRPLLVLAGGFSVAAAISVSGSRLALAYCLLVCACLAVLMVIRIDLLLHSWKIILVVLIVGVILSYMVFFREGVDTLQARIDVASTHEEPRGGIVGRVMGIFREPLKMMDIVPPLGNGLGTGTTVGVVLMGGRYTAVESEWGRVVVESGIIVGFLYLLYRTLLCTWIGKFALHHGMYGNILPLLLYGAFAPNIMIGQFSRTSDIGFTMLEGGLCLAACNTYREDTS